MPDRTISQTFKVGGVLTNADSAKLSDPTATFGIRRNDTLEVVVADGTAMNNTSTGVYQYTFAALANVAYTAYIEFVFDGDTIFVEFAIPAVSDDFGMVSSYNSLRERIGKYLYGIRTGFAGEQENEIEDCIHDGLHDVYTAHAWSFFRPVKDISTTAPYATGTVTVAAGVVTLTGGTFPTWAADGLLKVADAYYSVASRDGDAQITLDDTSVTVAVASTFQLARPEVPLDDAFEAVANDSDLTYYPDQNDLWPPVRQRHDRAIRTFQQDRPYFDRPILYSVRTVEFDPTVGSRKRLAFYPTPDAAYVLRVPMILRPTMIDETNQYPVGGETLAQVILEACLAAAERNFDEQNKRHTERFQQLLPLAILADMEKSAPTSLGPDCPKGVVSRSGVYDADYLRASRIGSLTIDGDSL
jgi:hypothetical protein